MEIGYVGWAAAAVALGAIFWFVSVMNRFARLSVKITESDSGVDVALTKRYDTLTNKESDL
jgi:LemA protein